MCQSCIFAGCKTPIKCIKRLLFFCLRLKSLENYARLWYTVKINIYIMVAGAL